MKCKICSKKTNILKKIKKINILKCTNCKFVFFEKMPLSYNYLYYNNKTKNRKFEKKNKYFEMSLKPYLKKCKSFIDIGCSTGINVNFAKKNNVKEAYGIDLDKEALQWGKKNFGLKNLYCENIETSKSINKQFELVYCNHTIEHIQNLTKFMEFVKKITKKNGKVIIRCPNYGRKWHKEIIRIGHENYFNNQNMILLFKKYGFKVIQNPKINIKYDIYYRLNYYLKNKLNLFQIWLTFEKK